MCFFLYTLEYLIVLIWFMRERKKTISALYNMSGLLVFNYLFRYQYKEY